MSPSSPAAMSSLTLRTGGLKTKVWPTMRVRPPAAARGLTLLVGHTFVFSPPVRKVKELIAAGELGDIYFVTTQRVNLGLHQKDVSVVWDLAPHDLSILFYWLGEHACAVSVYGRGCIVPEIPDVAFIN